MNGCVPGCTTRRAVLVGAGAVGVAALTGCQAYGEPAVAPAAPAEGGGGAPAGGSTGGPSGAPRGGADPAAAPVGNALVRTADVPVGGGKILGDQDVVVTQPRAGQFKAFSATCTHQGCTVSSVANGTISCRCHGSTFDAGNGSVKGGPAPRPLAAKSVTVRDGQVFLT
jgi:Rieske Fe-S protein